MTAPMSPKPAAPLQTAGSGDDLASARMREYAALVSEASADALRQLDEVRLPLHILLASRFGDLNENQEELLGAARAAAEQADQALRRLKQIADLDAGTLSLRQDRVQIGALLRSLEPGLIAAAERSNVRLAMDIPPGLPAICGDRARLSEAFESLLTGVIRGARAGDQIALHAARQGQTVIVDVRHGTLAPAGDTEATLVDRVVSACGGRLERQSDHTRVAFRT